MSKEENKEVKEEVVEEVAEETAEDVVEEKKEPDSDEIIEGLKAELDKAKNSTCLCRYRKHEETSTERCRYSSKISLPTASNGNLANS